MGLISLLGMLDTYWSEDTMNPDFSMYDIMHWHLTSNHYPPADPAFVIPCLNAVDAMLDGRGEDTLISLPDEFVREGKTSVPAGALIEIFNLEGFLIQRNEEESNDVD